MRRSCAHPTSKRGGSEPISRILYPWLSVSPSGDDNYLSGTGVATSLNRTTWPCGLFVLSPGRVCHHCLSPGMNECDRPLAVRSFNFSPFTSAPCGALASIVSVVLSLDFWCTQVLRTYMRHISGRRYRLPLS